MSANETSGECLEVSEIGEENVASVESIISLYFIPFVCVLGILGNVVNLIILTRQRFQKALGKLQEAANVCLIAMAISDLMFCVLAFLTMIVPADRIFPDRGFVFQYGRYAHGLINIFIMESTLLTVTMSLERFIPICYPLQQTLYLKKGLIKRIIVSTFIFSIVFNIPVMFRFQPVVICAFSSSIDSTGASFNYTGNISAILTTTGPLHSTPSPRVISSIRYSLNTVPLCGSTAVDTAYRITWAFVGNFLPLIFLVFFNVRMYRQIMSSHKKRLAFDCEETMSMSSYILTLTLLAIVLMFLVLVAPSETVLFLMQMSNSKNLPAVEAVLNLMQTINFSFNFFLYAIISPYFRDTIRYWYVKVHINTLFRIEYYVYDYKNEFKTSLMH
ncbi:FMRFamide receptor-like [Physella acuta]|uniref:FMRFamide receptor-like n=1 Tax=Physella acuta TaxID=109671 RepID=UPI0027DB9F6F|nr:FMRFamide receptor-like [Physella acuta]